MAITFKQLMEDQYTSEFKVKKWVDPTTGKTRERKIRPHRVEFDASKLRGEPSQDDDRGDHGMKESFNSTGQGSVKTHNYSWGKMKTVHHGADFSIPLHPEHHEAIAKLQDQQEHKFKTEDGKHWTAKRVGSDVHFQGANGGNSTTVSHASMREETEQDLANELHEVLSKDAKAGDWIHDFVHSTNPKFEGKSKKERIKMALGAYYGKQQNEQAPVAPVPDKKYIKGTPEHKAYKATKKPINGMPTNKMSCEEVELTEANHREFASQGKMHPDMAKHMVVGRNMDFYAKGTGDKLSGTVTKNDGKVVHVRADKDGRTAAGDKHIFNIASKLDEALTAKTSAPKALALGVNGQPKSTEVKSTDKSEVPFDGPYTTNTGGNIKDKSGAVHSPMSRARHLARMAIPEAKYAGLEKEDKPGKVKTAIVKLHPNGVEGETVEGWKDEKKPVKEDVQKVNVPAYLRKLRGDKPLELKDLKRKDTISDPENLRKATGVSEDAKPSYKEFAMMLEYESDENGRFVYNKGTYGKSYQDPEGADDADDKVAKTPAKRGPKAGSKRGARANYGSSKLHTK